LAGLALLGAGVPASAEEAPGSLLDTPHPGRPEALRLASLAGEALEEGREEDAASLLGLAVTRDPLLLEAWVNRSAVAIRRCRPAVARGSAAVARRLDPGSRAAANNHRLAARLECDGEAQASGAARREAALLDRPNDAEAWIAAARARREAGHRLVAAWHEEQALREREDPAGRLRLADDLEGAGLWRAALAALGPLEGEAAAERRQSLRAGIERHAPAATTLGRELAARLPGDRESAAATLGGMAEVLLNRGEAVDRVRDELEGLLDRFAAQRIVEPWGRLRPGALWRRVAPPAGSPWPALVLRRFPSDTQLAFYRWPAASEPPSPASVAGRLTRAAAVARSEWEDCPPPLETGPACRTAALEVDLGGQGRTRVRLWGLGSGEPPPGIAAISLVGDAGCGDPCREAARADLRALLATFEPPDEPPPAAEGAAESWVLPAPPAWQPPGAGDEREQPWRSVSLTEDVVVDLPPGVVGRPLSGGFPEPGGSPRSALWLRGRFVDRTGRRIELGNQEWAGWIDVGPAEGPSLEDWVGSTGSLRLAADPAARAVGADLLSEAIGRAGGEGSGAVARLRGGAFSGDWLWIRRRLAGRQVDIHLPVAEGAGSLSLLWIGLTVRPRSGEPPPALVDLSSRFEVRFSRFEGRRSRHDPREGVLLAAELETAVPRGFRITVSGMSRDGFPIKGRHPDGSRLTVARWRASREASVEGRRRQAEARIELQGATEWRLERERRGAQTWSLEGSTAEGPVCATLLVPEEPEADPAFLLWLIGTSGSRAAEISTACELLKDARLRR
jgi:hypothetical protein